MHLADELLHSPVKGLGKISKVVFFASSNTIPDWNGTGQGTVAVSHATSSSIVFDESGVWTSAAGRSLNFRNVFRWSKIGPAVIRLEHLRFGNQNPVELFDLVHDSESRWSSLYPHICGNDVYAASLIWSSVCVELNWNIVGPKKNVVLRYSYS